MTVDVLMPDAAGTLLKWNYAAGDSITVGDVLCEVETDKTVVEVPADIDGVLQTILVAVGTEGIQPATPLAVLASSEEYAAAAAAPRPAASTQQVAPVLAEAVTGAAAGMAPGRERSSPAARRLAREAGVGIQGIKGSGPGGRILERDVVALIEKIKTDSVAAAHTQPEESRLAAAAHPIPHDSNTASSSQAVPLTGMRRSIAERLVLSKQTVPHFYLAVDIELDALDALRKQLNDEALLNKEGQPRYRLSVNDFIVKALAVALQEVPAANAVWAGDKILRFSTVDVGVAVALGDGEGLLTPVIRDAAGKSLAAISNEVKELAGRARSRKLHRNEYEGGVSSVSNLGMHGIKEFAAIINPPQSSILAVGAGEPRAVVRDGALVVATVMTATLSCDHRVIDGVLGAHLLAIIKRLIEAPTNLLL